MALHISVSSIKDFMTCRRLYYYKRIKKYEKSAFHLPFFVGKVVHEGMAHLLAKKKNAIELMVKYYKEEREKVKREFTLNEKELHELNLQEPITKGMVAAYQRKYAKMLRDTEVLGSEVEGALQFGDDVIFVIKMDNLVKVRGKKILHELKTSKYITPEYVKMVQTDLQTAAYFHFHNVIWEDDPIQEIMYDVIRKPSIRKKKSESDAGFVTRLQEWYDKPDGDESVFHIERFKEPKITCDALVNTVTKVSEDMKRCKEKEDYYEDWDKCASYYGDICPYYDLCHEGGETKENLVLYQIRKSYHVNKENKGVKK